MSQKLRILSDGWIFEYQKFGGINSYLDHLIANTAKQCEWTITLDKPIKELRFRHASPKVLTEFHSPLGAKINHRINQWIWDRRNAKTDIYHPSYYAWYSCPNPARLSKPIVATLHDCIHERYPDHQKRDPYSVPAKKEMIEKADCLICITENTASDIDHYYPGHSDKIRVVLSGSAFSPPHQERPADLDYFAFVGNRDGYKNFHAILQALHLCKKKGKNLKLKISGKPLTDDEQQTVSTLGLQDQIELLGFLPDEQLPSFYYNSVALLYPSLYEGFGLPALDALASGSTTIAHFESSLPEVVGDAGPLVNCRKPEEIAGAMSALLDPTYREPLLKNAKIQADKLSWKNTARSTVEVYQSLL